MNAEILLEKQSMNFGSSINDDSPLRAFLRSNHNVTESKWVFENSIASADKDFRVPSHKSGHIINGNQQEMNAMCLEDDNESTLSFGLDIIALGGEAMDKDISTGVVSSGKNIYQQHSAMNQCPTFPKEILLKNMTPYSNFVSRQKKKKWQQKKNFDLSKKQEIQSLSQSYCTLNKLMERTASSRCLLLEQTKKGNGSSLPLMKPLSTSAFKTIISSTKITSNTSATSFRNTTIVQDNFTSSDFINSSFNETIDYSQKEPEKRCMVSAFDPSLLSPTTHKSTRELKKSSITGANQSGTSLTNSLPSCGSLEGFSSESEPIFDQVIQKTSLHSNSQLEISEPIQITPVSEKEAVFGDPILLDTFRGSERSSGSLITSSSLESDQSFNQLIHVLASSSKLGTNGSKRKLNSCHGLVGRNDHSSFQSSSSSLRLETSGSFQTNRKFNTFQDLVGKNHQSSRRPIRDLSCGDLPCRTIRDFSSGHLPRILHRQRKFSNNKASKKISNSMKLELRRELKRTPTKIIFLKNTPAAFGFRIPPHNIS